VRDFTVLGSAITFRGSVGVAWRAQLKEGSCMIGLELLYCGVAGCNHCGLQYPQLHSMVVNRNA
jgi:hypothetical protein